MLYWKLLIGAFLVVAAVGVAYACGGMRCWTDADGRTVCNYCNCEGQCF